mgnify:CR=1 FL=1
MLHRMLPLLSQKELAILTSFQCRTNNLSDAMASDGFVDKNRRRQWITYLTGCQSTRRLHTMMPLVIDMCMKERSSRFDQFSLKSDGFDATPWSPTELPPSIVHENGTLGQTRTIEYTRLDDNNGWKLVGKWIKAFCFRKREGMTMFSREKACKNMLVH